MKPAFFQGDFPLLLGAFDLFRDPWLDLIIPLVFGGGVIGVAVGMHRMETRREPLVDRAESDLDAAHLKGMIRRRKQIAILIGILGVLLTLSNSWIPWAKIPALTTVYLLALLILVVWILLLTSGDFMANRVYLALRLGQIHQRQREMEKLLTHQRAEASGNKRPESESTVADESANTNVSTSREQGTPLHRMLDADRAGHDPELN